MLFKGTERVPKGQIDRLVTAAAGHCNAETGEDSTHYWFTFPSGRWELALAIEADRMCHARFDPREVELERRVIAEERARELSSPQGRLDQHAPGGHLPAASLSQSDPGLAGGRRADRRRRPDGLLSPALPARRRGPGRRRRRAGRTGPWTGSPRSSGTSRPARSGRDRPSVVEPRQSGRRDFSLAEPDGVARGLLGWRTVPRGHADVAALDVLSDLLSCGRRSRLWQALVETDGAGDLGRGGARDGAAGRTVADPARGRSRCIAARGHRAAASSTS